MVDAALAASHEGGSAVPTSVTQETVSMGTRWRFWPTRASPGCRTAAGPGVNAAGLQQGPRRRDGYAKVCKRPDKAAFVARGGRARRTGLSSVI